MTNGSERLDRIERILEEVARSGQDVDWRLQEMAVRQRYHDEALERFDARAKETLEAVAIDAENIRALERLGGGQPA